MINCVYIHIPFCEKKCNYCAFCSFELIKYKKEYLKSLKKEIKFFYKNEKLKTLYIGGGTPSLLDTEEISDILNCFCYDNNCEITLEMNPKNLSYEKLKGLKSSGINRYSLGVQSFDDELLKILGRTHSKKEIIETLDNFEKLKIDNYSIDLMYGLPNQTMDKWIETLNFALNFNIKHVSLYGLNIESKTYFAKFPPKNLPDLDMQANMYEKAIEILNKRFIHYEFSNFALNKNYYSKHNMSYWMRKNYYGFGISASGFIGNKRYTNTYNFKEYIQNPLDKKYEKLSLKQQKEEEIFLNLRTSNGLDINYFNKKYNCDILKTYEKLLDKFTKNNFMEIKENKIKLTKKGILLSNEILCEFIDI